MKRSTSEVRKQASSQRQVLDGSWPVVASERARETSKKEVLMKDLMILMCATYTSLDCLLSCHPWHHRAIQVLLHGLQAPKGTVRLFSRIGLVLGFVSQPTGHCRAHPKPDRRLR